MPINFTQRQTISAVDIGWSGISINDLVIGISEGRINENYLKYLENKFGLMEGRILKKLQDDFVSDLPTQIKAITGLCFREASDALYFNGIDKALTEKYPRKNTSRGTKVVYRDPITKELIYISAFRWDNREIINVDSTSKDVAKRLLLEKMIETDDGFAVDTEKLTAGLENLSAEACPHSSIYWDPATKGLIKTSPGYDLQIPDRIIEVTTELNIDAVVCCVRNYLNNHRLSS